MINYTRIAIVHAALAYFELCLRFFERIHYFPNLIVYLASKFYIRICHILWKNSLHKFSTKIVFSIAMHVIKRNICYVGALQILDSLFVQCNIFKFNNSDNPIHAKHSHQKFFLFLYSIMCSIENHLYEHENTNKTLFVLSWFQLNNFIYHIKI